MKQVSRENLIYLCGFCYILLCTRRLDIAAARFTKRVQRFCARRGEGRGGLAIAQHLFFPQ